jgi:hypothetical protein
MILTGPNAVAMIYQCNCSKHERRLYPVQRGSTTIATYTAIKLERTYEQRTYSPNDALLTQYHREIIPIGNPMNRACTGSRSILALDRNRPTILIVQVIPTKTSFLKEKLVISNQTRNHRIKPTPSLNPIVVFK